ncbi:MAG: arsenic resistance N-acetyltransferase ArsN2 [Acidiferrobacterales bacterium]
MVGENSIDIRLAPRELEVQIKRLLVECELPDEDFPLHLEHFHVALKDGSLVGTVGLEIYQRVGLLRSLAVARPYRNHGHARRLYAAAELHARKHGIDVLYLLTNTASEYFAKLGFVSVERASVPNEIKATQEFAIFCPATATCMMKHIRGDMQ